MMSLAEGNSLQLCIVTITNSISLTNTILILLEANRLLSPRCMPVDSDVLSVVAYVELYILVLSEYRLMLCMSRAVVHKI